MTTTNARRSVAFNDDPHPRFWWHHHAETRYVPAIYEVLADDEWALLDEWYRATLEAESIGEINVPAMSMIQGFISGGGLTRIVQLGHYYGYSALLIGFWLRAMGHGGRLVSIDIDPKATEFTQHWLDRAGLNEQVTLLLMDSASGAALSGSVAAFGGASPQLIIVDSSHQYAHTKRELALWVPAMESQSIMLLHDTSTYAREFDQRGLGGVQQALHEFSRRRKDISVLSLNGGIGSPAPQEPLVYRDGCGIGILQKH